MTRSGVYAMSSPANPDLHEWTQRAGHRPSDVAGDPDVRAVGPPAGRSSARLTVTVPTGTFSNGGTYLCRVRGCDSWRREVFTAFCEFTMDTTAPGRRRASSATLPQDTFPRLRHHARIS